MPRLRRLAEPLRRGVAAGCALLTLALVVLAVCPTLHAWLHHEKHLDNDDGCAVVLFAHGITPAAAVLAVLAVAPLLVAAGAPAPRAVFLPEPRFQLPPGRGPPRR